MRDSFERVARINLLFYLFFVAALLGAIAFNIRPAALVQAFLSPEVLFAVRLSLLTATTTTIISLVLALPAAYFLARRQFPGRSLLETFLDLPLVLPPIVGGVALLLFFRSPLGRWLESMGLSPVFTAGGVILAQFTVVATYALRLLKTTFETIDPRLEQVARTLGCNSGQAFRRVTLPLARPGILATTVITWARALGEFGATVTFAGATRFKTEVLPTAIYLSLSSVDIDQTVALALILIFLALLALWLLRLAAGIGRENSD